MSKAYILAIDIGTTSTKAVAFDDFGNLLQKQQVGYPTFSPTAHFQEQSPMLIYESLMRATVSIIQQMGCSPQGIVFSSAMHSVIAVDAQGNLLTNSMIWADGRSQDYANQLRTTALGKKIYYETGTPIHAMSPLCKIAWLRDHQPDVFMLLLNLFPSKNGYFINGLGSIGWIIPLLPLLDYSIFDSSFGSKML
ncbi:MAG: hypothetical protein HC912_06085 [Saprospiraceae bacterium]|nr:hypothetical protein [Saprospiraceae bacterium]